MKENTLTVQQIEETLKSGVVSFKYIKKDGSERIASGTKNMDFIKEQGAEPKGNGTEKIGVITYYDLEKESWRSFNPLNFVCFI